MKKQGKLKLQRHRNKLQKQHAPEKPQVEYSSDSDAESGEEWADMLDDEEQQYILNRLAKQPQLLSNVPAKEDNKLVLYFFIFMIIQNNKFVCKSKLKLYGGLSMPSSVSWW